MNLTGVKLIIFMVLMIPGSLLASHDNYAIEPQTGVMQFTLATPDTISREVVTGKILAQVSNDFNGEIELIWTNERFANSVQLLRSALISHGVAPYRIKLTHDIGGYREQGSDGIQIVVQQFKQRLPECSDKGQSYRLDIHDDLGCAVNNIRSRALVNPYQYRF
ncbi:hypothetical protein PMPD1_3713 [Paramixta manurensis]|uniref:Uncharacterized protein n=1 Tax=Paramixta manurensis TaxID=2740817 RepID=A0A6M8UJP1_9GAMM|nr:hypothetical protein PMPD1_3713 [Erwiniaceae bacterium PD-1]